MKKKFALVLSGGGFKGAYQLGALRYLKEHWMQLTGLSTPMHFDIIAGVSVGALNGALIAGKQFSTLEDIWKQVHQNGGQEIYRSAYLDNEGKIKMSFQQLQQDLIPDFKNSIVLKGLWNSFIRLFHKSRPGLLATLLQEAERNFEQHFPHFSSLADNTPLLEKLRKYARLEQIPDTTRFLCGVVSLNDGLYYALSDKDFSNNEDFAQAIAASAAMPVIWPPTEKISVGGRQLYHTVDGGIRNTSPLGDVVQYINADPEPEVQYEVIIINCNSGYISPRDGKWNIADIALRTLTEITLSEIFNNDIAEFLKINELVLQGRKGNILLQHQGDPLRYFEYKLIQPLTDELGNTLDSRAETIQSRDQLGYLHAEQAWQQAKKDLWS